MSFRHIRAEGEREQKNLVALFEGTRGRVRADPDRGIEALVRPDFRRRPKLDNCSFDFTCTFVQLSLSV